MQISKPVGSSLARSVSLGFYHTPNELQIIRTRVRLGRHVIMHGDNVLLAINESQFYPRKATYPTGWQVTWMEEFRFASDSA